MHPPQHNPVLATFNRYSSNQGSSRDALGFKKISAILIHNGDVLPKTSFRGGVRGPSHNYKYENIWDQKENTALRFVLATDPKI